MEKEFKVDFLFYSFMKDNLIYYHRDVYQIKEIKYSEDYMYLKLEIFGDIYEFTIEPDFFYKYTNYFSEFVEIVDAITTRNFKYHDLYKITINSKTNIYKILNKEGI